MIRRIARTKAALESKPRVCGDDPEMYELLTILSVVNPACAGMIRMCFNAAIVQVRKPRVCGDDPPEVRRWLYSIG